MTGLEKNSAMTWWGTHSGMTGGVTLAQNSGMTRSLIHGDGT